MIMKICHFLSPINTLSKSVRSLSSKSPSNYCMGLVRHHDYENFLSTLLLNNSLRSSAIAIRAFNVEVARVQEQVTDEKIGLMRFQFWIDTIDKIYSNGKLKIPEHPVAQELYKACSSYSVTKRHLTRLINSRRTNISKKYFNSIDEMEKYSEDAVSPVYYSLLEVAGHQNVHCDHAASHLGKAQGLSNMLRSVEQSAKSRFVMLPLDMLIKYNLSQEDVLRCLDSQNMKDVVFEIASRANQHITKARSIAVPKEAKNILLPAVAVDSYLKNLQKKNFNIFDKTLAARNSSLPLTLYWNKFLSKY